MVRGGRPRSSFPSTTTQEGQDSGQRYMEYGYMYVCMESLSHEIAQVEIETEERNGKIKSISVAERRHLPPSAGQSIINL